MEIDFNQNEKTKEDIKPGDVVEAIYNPNYGIEKSYLILITKEFGYENGTRCGVVLTDGGFCFKDWLEKAKILSINKYKVVPI